ncbi:MAG: PolC-type DNA polymerase III, partial [Christensenellaceae bacterium]|nr:PolC-type DNA polymerase III [Christensenellaceae bacterium]
VYSKCFFSYGIRGKAKKKDGSIDFEALKRASRQNINNMVDSIKSNDRMLVSGQCVYDSYLREPCINIKSLSRMPKDIRMDNCENKRVELHLHTQMSAMDAVSPAADLIERAAKWGHKAIAIADHGVVQAFPSAFAAAKKHKIKLIPGCELYMCDYAVPIKNAKDISTKEPIVVLDFETTGLSTNHDRIIEIGAVKLLDGTIVDTFSTLVNPGTALNPKITELTGITDIMLINMPKPHEAVKKLLSFIGDNAIAAHNAPFDMGMLNSELKRMGTSINNQVIDTLVLARSIYPELKSYRLKSLCKHLGVVLQNAHRAVNDATATAQCLAAMLNLMLERGADTFTKVNEFLDKASFGNTNHISTLVSKQEGLKNLYYLVSQGHLKYFHRNMRIPRFEIEKHREGLLLGSACSNGELFQAALYGADDEVLESIAKFYDYIEIMPLDNNAYLLRENLVTSYDEIKQINIRLYNLGEKLGIPVVATGDVHFTDPDDSIYRAIIKASMNYSDFDKQEPLYFKTTEEMLDAFSYLGENAAYKVVVENTNLISDMVDNIRQYPKHPDGEFAVTFQPFWEDAEENIKNSTIEKAKEYYGYPFPDIVQKRLDKELKSILGYGFGTLYNIAQKLVKKSNDDGYVVGSRGSVGSSFVATMCGITEVNPLPPHYRCAKCSYSNFEVPKEYTCGIDLPDMLCPECGEAMIKDGYNIPFEVFLGFEGDKVPDIDLNFSGEYQAKAHAYVEELFGSDFVYRAGTISAMAEKTAFGYVNKYLEMKGTTASRAHKERLAQGLIGIKRTTGQHPGGIVVLPKEYSIYDFTPIQHPADDSTGNTITTHFDFTSMHDILVKLDILGHDDPTMLHDLEHLTGVKYTDIPLDDKKVMSLFTSPEALGVKPEDILSPTGTLGVPEFGTEFVQSMLIQTKPTTMDELLRISGLSHGTDVWAGNTEEIIKCGDAKLSECICTRDDIMNALIRYGLDNKLSFDTMERVRKGRGLPDDTVEIMKANNVPDWFIGSCQKIKYMFPKAHACAYVIMALRIAYYKVYYPLQYYAAYFTIRSVGFDSSTMILPNEVLKEKIKNFGKDSGRVGEKLTPTEKDELYALRMTLEMQSRGIKFLPADIYKSDSHLFLPEGDNSLRVPFNTLPGLGSSVAENIVAARNEVPFK